MSALKVAPIWAQRPESIILAEGEVHVWRAPVNCDAGALGRYESILALSERERARKFLIPGARREFIATRGILRELLTAYLGGSAAGLRFNYGRQGKPAVSASDGAPPLRFNVSHSHGVAAFAFARQRDVGIDVEKIRQDVAGEEIAKLYFSQSEAAELRRLRRESYAEGFFKCWTRKEAYLKARGEGLQLALSSFQVSIASDKRQELIDETGSRWTISAFEPAPGFTGAVAAQGKDWKLRYWEWRDPEEGSFSRSSGWQERFKDQKSRLTVQ